MANERNDRNYQYRTQDDDRRRFSGRLQDDDTGYTRRQSDDYGRDDDEIYRGRERGSQGYDYDDRRRDDRDSSSGERDRGHAFDFARRDRDYSGSREGYGGWEGQDRYRDPQGYGVRSSSGFDRGYGPAPYRGASESRRQGESEGRTASGLFRGKGPKGYTRSDERIKEDVSDRLSDDDELDASDVTVQVSGGEVTLTGFVDSRDAKRAAEDCAEACSGVKHVQNNLRVRDRNVSGSQQQTGGDSGGQTASKAKPKDS